MRVGGVLKGPFKIRIPHSVCFRHNVALSDSHPFGRSGDETIPASVMARAYELIAEELTLRQLREGLNLTQSVIAERLEIGQHSVSRMENRGDIKLSTLRTYIEALGGRLTITPTFPDHEEVKIQPNPDS